MLSLFLIQEEFLLFEVCDTYFMVLPIFFHDFADFFFARDLVDYVVVSDYILIDSSSRGIFVI